MYLHPLVSILLMEKRNQMNTSAAAKSWNPHLLPCVCINLQIRKVVFHVFRQPSPPPPPPSLLGKQSQSGNTRFTVGQYWLIIKINGTNSVNFVGTDSVNFVGNMLSKCRANFSPPNCIHLFQCCICVHGCFHSNVNIRIRLL